LASLERRPPPADDAFDERTLLFLSCGANQEEILRCNLTIIRDYQFKRKSIFCYCGCFQTGNLKLSTLKIQFIGIIEVPLSNIICILWVSSIGVKKIEIHFNGGKAPI